MTEAEIIRLARGIAARDDLRSIHAAIMAEERCDVTVRVGNTHRRVMLPADAVAAMVCRQWRDVQGELDAAQVAP